MNDASRYKNPRARQEYKNAWQREYYSKHPELKKEEQKRTNEIKRKNKKMAVEFLGGKCSKCGILVTDFNLCIFDFHHPEGIKKETTTRNIMGRKWERVKEAIKDCILFCSNCHRIEHHSK